MRMTLLLILFVTLVCSGCVSVKYNVKTHKFKYFRMGDQKIDGFKAVIKSDGSTTISVESQEAKAEALNDLIATAKMLASAAEGVAK